MHKDPTKFRQRFQEYKNGKMPYENGLPKYKDGTSGLNFIDAFVQKMGPSLYAALQRHGVKNTNYAFANMMRQLALESDYGRSRVAREQNNFGGVGFNGSTYTTYKDVDEFVDKYVKLMNGRYAKALGVYDPAEYAKIVHGLGYFTGSLDNYIYNMSHMKSLNNSLANHVRNNPDIYPKEGFTNGVPTRIYRPEDGWRKMPKWTDTPEYNPPVNVVPNATQQNPITVPMASEAMLSQNDPVSDLEQKINRYNTITDAFGWGDNSKKKFGLPPLKSLLPSLDEMTQESTQDYIKNILQIPQIKPLGGYKNGKRPGFKDGKGGYVRQNGNDIKFDEDTGELVDQVTGERGTMLLPEITITRANPKNYRSSYDPNAAMEGFNILTFGGLNNVDPTQWARRVYDLPKTMFGPMRFSTYMDRWINGNEGLVSSNFQQQHPWYSAGINLLGGAALVGGNTQGLRIIHNIANRNQFFYKYLTPFSYDNPLKRGLNVAQKILTEPKINLPQDFTPSWMGKINNGIGKGTHGTYIGYIPEDIVAKAELNGIENTPEYINYALKLSRLENKFRDAAFRKYLNLPERDPLYIANQDGTFSYNLPYIEQQYAKNGLKIDPVNRNLGVDWITGNGGKLESTKNISFGHGIGSDSSKRFSMQEMTDTWDLHPFGRAEDQLSKKYGDFVRKVANNTYTKLYDRLYGLNKPFKYISGYNLLGGKQLNRIRYSDKVPFQNIIDKISKKLVNFEAGPVLGGKPFVMKTNIPLTEQLILEGESPVYRTQYGLNADNILPQTYFDWLKYGDKKIASDFELGVPF